MLENIFKTFKYSWELSCFAHNKFYIVQRSVSLKHWQTCYYKYHFQRALPDVDKSLCEYLYKLLLFDDVERYVLKEISQQLSRHFPVLHMQRKDINVEFTRSYIFYEHYDALLIYGDSFNHSTHISRAMKGRGSQNIRRTNKALFVIYKYWALYTFGYCSFMTAWMSPFFCSSNKITGSHERRFSCFSVKIKFFLKYQRQCSYFLSARARISVQRRTRILSLSNYFAGTTRWKTAHPPRQSAVISAIVREQPRLLHYEIFHELHCCHRFVILNAAVLLMTCDASKKKVSVADRCPALSVSLDCLFLCSLSEIDSKQLVRDLKFVFYLPQVTSVFDNNVNVKYYDIARIYKVTHPDVRHLVTYN